MSRQSLLLRSAGLAISIYGLDRITALWKAYLAALDTGGALPGPENSNPEWSTIHVPALVAAMDKGGIAEKALRAFILAVADYETQQGRTMTELCR